MSITSQIHDKTINFFNNPSLPDREKRWIGRRSYFIRGKSYFIMDLRDYRLFHCSVEPMILSNNMKPSFREYQMTFCSSTNYSDFPKDQTFTNFMTSIPNLTFTEMRVVSMEHSQRIWIASRKRLPFRTPGSVPFWDLHMFKLMSCWDQFSQIYRDFPTYHLEYPSVFSLFCSSSLYF